MHYVNGSIFLSGEFVKGSIGFEDGVIREVSSGYADEPLAKGIIIPCFSNAHTHLGDAFIRDMADGTLEELVAPPDGLKHRMLRGSSDEAIIKGISSALSEMIYSGTHTFCDFREDGLRGVLQMRAALAGTPLLPVVFGRPKGLSFSRTEMDMLIHDIDGVGVSSISDWDYSELKKLSKYAKAEGKAFALHASESKREDIDKILGLKPDFLVHMTKGTVSDFERVADAGVPVVICPRSNAFFGAAPNIQRMLKAGVEAALGTDNAMINKPSMFSEMEFAYKLSRLKSKKGASPASVLNMAYCKNKILNPHPANIEEGAPARFMVLSLSSKKPENAVVNTAKESDISLISIGSFLWMRHGK